MPSTVNHLQLNFPTQSKGDISDSGLDTVCFLIPSGGVNKSFSKLNVLLFFSSSGC